jgi:hypothetical protein
MNPHKLQTITTEMKTIGMLLLGTMLAHGQLAVTVFPLRVVGQKAVVPLAMRNGFSERIDSARAVVFLIDEQGRSVGPPTTRWVIGGGADKPGLAAGATNAFYFAIANEKPFATTNLTARVRFSRVVLQGGKLANIAKDVNVMTATK